VDLFVQALWEIQLVSDCFLDRMLELYQHMVTAGHLQGPELRQLKAWCIDIQQAGLVPPSLAARPSLPGPGPEAALTEARAAPLQVSELHRRDNSTGTGGGNGSVTVDMDAARSLYAAITNQTRNHTFAFPQRWCMHMDKVLYINLNSIGAPNPVGYAMQEQARLLHAVYRPFFRQVVFAGFGRSDVGSVGTPGIFSPCDTYVTHKKQSHGFFAHACLAGFLASDTRQSLTQGDSVGLLYINDDVVFDPCAVNRLNAGKVSSEIQGSFQKGVCARHGF
jgi:hypothetical protein